MSPIAYNTVGCMQLWSKTAESSQDHQNMKKLTANHQTSTSFRHSFIYIFKPIWPIWNLSLELSASIFWKKKGLLPSLSPRPQEKSNTKSLSCPIIRSSKKAWKVVQSLRHRREKHLQHRRIHHRSHLMVPETNQVSKSDENWKDFTQFHGLNINRYHENRWLRLPLTLATLVHFESNASISKETWNHEWERRTKTCLEPIWNHHPALSCHSGTYWIVCFSFSVSITA